MFDRFSLSYLRSLPTWEYLDDVYEGAESWLGRDNTGVLNPTPKALVYLPKEPAETRPQYLNRLARSPFRDFYAQAIRKFVNLVFKGQDFSSLPEGVDEFFLRQLASAVMRYGHAFVLVDFPVVTEPMTQAAYLTSGLHPNWVYYSPKDVINWQITRTGGKAVLESVVLRERVLLLTDQGEVIEERYRVLTPGYWSLYRVEETQRKRQVILVDQGTHALPEIPLACVYADPVLKVADFESRSPLKSLADLNITHYQVKSDHLRKVYLCCMPIPELKDSMRAEGDFVLGPNSIVHIQDPNGYFQWREPLATSITESRKEVYDLEASADILSAGYLTNPADRQAAASTVAQVAELESSLAGFVQSFLTGINQGLRFHGLYTGEEYLTLNLEVQLIKTQGIDSQVLIALTSLAEKDILSKRTALELMRRVIPAFESVVDVDSEIRAVGEAIQLVNVGQLGTQPATSTPPIDPQAILNAYVDLAKSGLIPVETCLNLINSFGVPS
jgi:hypothetical protein